VPLRLWPALVALELRYEAAHAREAASAPGGCYYYLSFIGTAPAARGRGYGSLLMRQITARADAEGRICLLEATSERSRALYKRHSFRVYETYRVTPEAPPVFFMRRDPLPPGAPPVMANTPLGGTPRTASPVPAGQERAAAPPLGKSLLAAMGIKAAAAAGAEGEDGGRSGGGGGLIAARVEPGKEIGGGDGQAAIATSQRQQQQE